MSDGYDVGCSELHGSSNLLLDIVFGAQGHGMDDAAGDGGQYGHALLKQAVASFCTAINTGVAALRADAEQTSAGLDATARAYAENDFTATDLVVGAGG